MLGRQSLILSATEVAAIVTRYGRTLPAFAGGWADDYFTALGAQQVQSMDYSDYEDAQFIHDMNLPWPQGQPPARFDVVFDGGTLEHVFNLPQALLNAMSLVKPGGCLLSVSPADGWLGHGFYQPQPELFFRFLTPENGFRLEGVWLAEFGQQAEKARLFRLKDPAVSGCRPQVPGRRPLVMLVWATRIAESDKPLAWPGQSNYTAMWSQPGTEGRGAAPSTRLRSWKQRLLAAMPTSLLQPVRRWRRQQRNLRLAKTSYVEEFKLELHHEPEAKPG